MFCAARTGAEDHILFCGLCDDNQPRDKELRRSTRNQQAGIQTRNNRTRAKQITSGTTTENATVRRSTRNGAKSNDTGLSIQTDVKTTTRGEKRTRKSTEKERKND